MKSFYPFLMLFLFCSPIQEKAFSQTPCLFDEIYQKELSTNPQFKKNVAEADSEWIAYRSGLANTRNRITLEDTDTLYEIPLVIHVFHTGDTIGATNNPPDSVLEKWVDRLNHVYAADYPGYPSVGSGGVRIPFKFVLAKRDPFCDSTNGIDRIDMSWNPTYVSSGIQNHTTKGITEREIDSIGGWPIGQYFNVYLINKIDSMVVPSQGFTYPGNLAPLSSDGSYIQVTSLSVLETETLAHELGHAFGLFHTFNGGSSTTCPPTTPGGCTTDNDFICDTDPSKILYGAYYTDTMINPCTSMPFGVNGVQNNIMNYTWTPDHFTEGQKERMLYMIRKYRPNLIRSLAGLPPSGQSIAPVASTCNPPGTTHPTYSGYYNFGPLNVFLDSIQINSTGYQALSSLPYYNKYYIDHTTNCNLPIHTSLIAADTYKLAISTDSTIYSNPLSHIKVYIDFNNNGSFSDPGEVVMDTIASAGNHFASIVPPITAVQNTPLRMRVIADEAAASCNPCDSLHYGQAEDFSVTILPSIPLSLEQLNFSGRTITDHQAELKWSAPSSNLQIVSFELERSADGRHFTTIASVSYQKGQTSYLYNDFLTQEKSVYYYRLKLIRDNEIKSIFSQVLPLNFGVPDTESIMIFPNPASQMLTIQSSCYLAEIIIYNSTGKIVHRNHIASAKIKEKQLNISTLSNGIYFIQVIDLNGKQRQQKITKE